MRLRCNECSHDKLLAFICKRRGFCPSDGARRMSQTGAHVVDHVIPYVPVQQWVLSLPIPLRVLLAAQPAGHAGAAGGAARGHVAFAGVCPALCRAAFARSTFGSIPLARSSTRKFAVARIHCQASRAFAAIGRA